MAKRKRLIVPEAADTLHKGSDRPRLGPESGLSRGPAPIASVAGNAAAQAALEELAGEMSEARRTGRLIQSLPLGSIRTDHLVRDRMRLDDEEMAVLKSSIRARGQQTPIEVVPLEQGRYGLISGYRRFRAIEALHAETGAQEFAEIRAVTKPLDGASDSYVAMVEENEIRANLSFYERAHLVCEAVRLGVYPDTHRAIQTLFASAPPARRSKIASFVKLHRLLGEALRHPAAIPEKLGLRLVSELETDPPRLRALVKALEKAAPEDAAAERAVLEKRLSAPGPAKPGPEAPQEGIRVSASRGKVVLSGTGVTPELVAELKAWLAPRGRTGQT